MCHVSAVWAQINSCDEEADDVDHNEDFNKQMEIEKLSRMKEGVHSSILSLYKTVECLVGHKAPLIQVYCQNCF